MAEINNPLNLSTEFTYFNIPGIIICLLGTTSNVLLLVAFIKDPLKCFRNSGTYLVMNLAVSDYLMSLLRLCTYTVPKISSLYRILFPFIVWMGSSSCLSITSISIDRFLMVASPIKHRILMKGKVMILWITAIWIGSCIIPVILMLSNIHKNRGVQALCIAGLNVIIISAVMYSSTYYKLKKQSRNIALQYSIERRAQEIRILKEKRFLKTIIIIACVAFVCTVPYLVLDFLRFLVNISQVFTILYAVFNLIFLINFAVNPLIYILRLPNYRKTFYMLYCKRGTAAH